MGATMEALVFAGGDAVDVRWLDALPVEAWIVAADSGLEHVHVIGRRADLVVGDLDSVSAVSLDRAVAGGTVVEEHPADKDATDLELALGAAKRAGATRVTVVGAGGGRLDHFLANALLFAAPEWDSFELHALVGDAHVVVVRETAELRGAVGSVVSLLAPAGPARGIDTIGLRWALAGDELLPGSTRGVSNEMTAPIATVSLRDGVLIAIQPDADPDLIAQVIGGN
ncbi:MAG: thiamine diphosphokinase [Acidimicrobiia bacterium]